MKNKQWSILALDSYLAPHAADIELRMERYGGALASLAGEGKPLADFASGHHFFGFHRTEGGWVYREWAPAADALCLMGDFNGWNAASHPLTRGEDGIWSVYLDGYDALRHEQRVMVRVTARGQSRDRVPLYIRRTVQDERTRHFDGQIWMPEQPYAWHDEGFTPARGAPYVYEAHVGMAQEEGRVGTYRAFADERLPYIKRLGYTAVQLMAVMDHPYYASFGYQIGAFFAASSWFGTPEDLKYLVDAAHGLGLSVYLDLVHSHAAKNTREGVNAFDGTVGQFFHEGARGEHPAWNSKVFDYGKQGVLRFLLSNIKFWLEEYHFDGFRFDGVTSMLYLHHGLERSFTEYKQYFSPQTDMDACVYLMLANTLVHEVNPRAVTIAEDMSGMPGMALPVGSGGFGFDYRLGMGIPDLWVKYIKEYRDEQWDMRKLWFELNTRRAGEYNIGYCESHDQALVGDKTIMFRLADAAMYTDMDKGRRGVIIDRAVALHKMIRLVTASLAGEGYLNFMGNEFGHPEWIDFPREGNNWSFHYARRQWSLAENGYLKYQWLLEFDIAMVEALRRYKVNIRQGADSLWIDEDAKLLAYRRGALVFIVNFHPARSAASFFVPTWRAGRYAPVLSTDEERFGGQGRVAMDAAYETFFREDRGHGFNIYLPARCAAALEPVL